MERVILKPLKEIVRDPKTRMILKKDGESKPLTTFWRRRLIDGDVEIVKQKSFSSQVGKDSSKETKKEK